MAFMWILLSKSYQRGVINRALKSPLFLGIVELYEDWGFVILEIKMMLELG